MQLISSESLGSSLRAFVRGYARLQRQSIRNCAATGPGFARCLILTELRAGALSQTELSERLEIEKGGLSRAVSALVASGLALRKPRQEDGRVSMLVLTAKGEREAAKLDCELDALNRRLLNAMPAAERQSVASGIRSLGNALAAITTKGMTCAK